MHVAGKHITFAGDLISMSEKQAKSLIYSLGGFNQKTVTKQTTILVVSQLTTSFLSTKVRTKQLNQAKLLISSGYPIQIINEREFLILANRELVNCISNSNQ